MDDALRVGGCQSLRDLRGIVEGRSYRQRSVSEPIAQCRSLEQLGDQIRRPVVHTDVVDRQNGGMVQGCGGPRLLFEPPEPLRVAGKRPGQQLQRDRPSETRVERAIDLAHAARADEAGDFIRTESCAWRQA